VTILCSFLAALAGSNAGEIASAWGSVVGGIVAALGAGAAVYLTLRGRRSDETEKISTAIVTEVAQLAKFPLEQLATCRRIYDGTIRAPRQHLRVFMQTPEPTLYRAAAEHISLVPRPTLVTSFYIGLAETQATVNVVSSFPSADLFLTPTDVEGIGILLLDQCKLARQILAYAPIPKGQEKQLATHMLIEIIKMLDAEIDRSKVIFPTTQDYQKKTTI
jgi:hypothetical protein